MGKIRYRRFQAAAVGAQLSGVDGQKSFGLHGITGGGQRAHHDHGEILQRGVQLLHAQREVCVFACHQSRFQQRLHVLAQLLPGGFGPLVHPSAFAEKHRRVHGQIIHRRGDFGVDGSKIAIHAPGNGAVFQFFAVLPELFGGAGGAFLLSQLFRQGQQLFPKAGKAAFCAGGQHFRRRQQQCIVHIGGAALGGGVKGAHGVDLIVKELAAHRLIHQRGKYIQDAAAEGKLAGAFHLVAAGIARPEEQLRQILGLVPSAHLQRDGQLRHELWRQRPGHEGVGGGDDDAGRLGAEAVEGLQTAALPLTGGNGHGAKLPLPAQQYHRGLTGEGRQIACQFPGLPLVAAEEDGAAVCGAAHCRTHAGALDALQSADGGGTAAAIHPADQLCDLGQGFKFFQQLEHGSVLSVVFSKFRGNGYRTPQPKEGV